MGDSLNYQTVFVVFVAVMEVVLFTQHDYRAMASVAVIAGLFAILFFLSTIRKNGKFSIASVLEYWKPPHQRVKEVVVGNQETSNDTVIRVEKETKEVYPDESNRNSRWDDNHIKNSTSCHIKVDTHSY